MSWAQALGVSDAEMMEMLKLGAGKLDRGLYREAEKPFQALTQLDASVETIPRGPTVNTNFSEARRLYRDVLATAHAGGLLGLEEQGRLQRQYEQILGQIESCKKVQVRAVVVPFPKAVRRPVLSVHDADLSERDRTMRRMQGMNRLALRA